MAGPMSLPVVAWSRLSVNAKEALFCSDIRRHLVCCSTAISTRTNRAASCQAYKNGRGYSTSRHRGRRRWQEGEAAPSSREDWRDLQRNSRGAGRQNTGGPSSQRQDEWKPREARAAGLKAGWRGDAVYGVAPVLAAMTAQRRELFKLFVQESMDMKKRKDVDAIRRILSAAEELGMEVHKVGKHELNLVTGDRPHQGLVLDCSPLMWQQMDRLPTAASAAEQAAAAGLGLPCWLALDEVWDPQNLGAMVRSAHMLGAAGVLACDRNCAPLSAAVSKASAGAVEVMPLHTCRQLPRTLQDAALNGWTVVGAAAGAGSVSCNAFDVRQPTVLVMGNEGYGLRTNVARCCHQMLKIDMAPSAGRPGVVDSLNVSVATGILLHRIVTSAAPCHSIAPTQS